MAHLLLVFWAVSTHILQWLYSFKISTNPKRVPFSPHPIQLLLFSAFFIIFILTGVKCHIFFFIYNSLMAGGTEHFSFICHLYFLFAKMSIPITCPFLNGIALLLSPLSSCQMHNFQVSSHSVGYLFTLLIVSFTMQKFLNLEVNYNALKIPPIGSQCNSR